MKHIKPFEIKKSLQCFEDFSKNEIEEDKKIKKDRIKKNQKKVISIPGWNQY